MLKKLLKYDLQNVLPFIFIFHCLALVFALLTRIFLQFEDSLFLYIIGRVCAGTTYSMIFSIIINTLMRSWVRFKQNLYGDESYITHTLPVTKHAIYLSKFLAAILTLFISVFVVLISLVIAHYSTENLQLLKNFLFTASGVIDGFYAILIGLVVVLFLEFAVVLQCGFAGVILGFKMRSAKTGFSVLFGFVIYGVTQVIAFLLLYLAALFNRDLMQIFTANSIISPAIIRTLLVYACGAYALILAGGYLLNIKLFQKGVNVD